MTRTVTRRQAMGTGMAVAAATGGWPSAEAASSNGTGPGHASSWFPGPAPDYRPDRTPGTTPVRLGNYIPWDGKIAPGDWVKGIRDSGLTAAAVPPEPWGTAPDSVIRELKAALVQHDVEIFEVCGYTNLLHTDEPSRRANLAHVARCIEIADRLGCRSVGTISGSRNPESNQWGDNYAVHPDNWTIETWRLLVDCLRQIFRDTAGMKAAVGMEAQVTTNQDSPLAHRNLIVDVGDPRLKVTLDPINMVTWTNYYHTTRLINDCFDLLGENIMGCHMKDTGALPHDQTICIQECCTGRGIFDHAMYLVRLSRMAWPRSIWPDHIPADQMPEAYAHIRKTAALSGVTIYGDK